MVKALMNHRWLSLPKTKNLLFDLDNTLIDRQSALKAFAYFSFKQCKQSIDLFIEIDNWGYTSRSVFVQHLIAAGLVAIEANEFLQTFYRFMREFDYRNRQVLHLLTSLKKRYELFIVSNGSLKNQLEKIKHSGLHQLLAPQNIFISQAVGVAKPDSEFFRRVMDQAKLELPRSLVIGDDPRNDIDCAAALGL